MKGSYYVFTCKLERSYEIKLLEFGSVFSLHYRDVYKTITVIYYICEIMKFH